MEGAFWTAGTEIRRGIEGRGCCIKGGTPEKGEKKFTLTGSNKRAGRIVLERGRVFGHFEKKKRKVDQALQKEKRGGTK